MLQKPLSSTGPKSYDLCLRSGRGGWFSADHGLTLTDDHIVWSEGDRNCEGQLREVADVHLQTGKIGDSTIASCRLNFRDGSTLLITSNNSRGLQDDEHDRLYATFALDLHARLAALKDARISFTAGFSAARYRFGQGVIVVAGLFFLVTPTVLLFMTGSWSMIWTLYLGVGLVWPVYRLMMANAPRRYDPRDIPPLMIPASPRVN
jgi:hypothetical protein